MLPIIDDGRKIDWGATTTDYAAFRPGPPGELYEILRTFGVGLPGQRILDLGTGTGVVARALSRSGADVAAIDVAPEQIAEAKRLAATEQLTIDFRVVPAEEPPFANHSFEVATANQCFLYFDKQRAIAALRRVLVPGGRLVTSHFNWLPKIDSIAAASEKLILQYNPYWLSAGFDGTIPSEPDWMPADVAQEALFWFDVNVPFDRNTWRGRIRASRGIGASLPWARVETLDEEHAMLLNKIAPEKFTIRHRIDARILRFP